jgi:peptidoglycan/xylan/chitin deacetylase (PgdA/CDA1 family)
VIARLRNAARDAGALALIPLSAIPLLLVGPSIVDSHGRFQRTHGSDPYPAPAVTLTAAEARRYAPARPFTGAVPVLAYHGVSEENDGYSVSRETLDRQLAMLRRTGYRSITIADFLRFRSGDDRGLPPRPVLITFDDGRLDSYRGADRILQRHGMSAVMFAITGQVAAANPFYLSWRELHRMEDSGRWEIQPHAHDGHRKVVTDPSGRTAPFYAALRYTRSEGRETFAAYTQRVASDIYALKDAFAEQGLSSEAFAAPYGDAGQRSGDPRIRDFLDGLLATQFRVAFVQSRGNDPRYARATGPALRYEVHTATRTADLHDWLVRHNPAEVRARRAARARA